MSTLPKNKSTQKLNNNVRKALAQATALAIQGFDHFSYTAEWHNFPGSLRVECHFSSLDNLQAMQANQQEAVLIKIIQHSFLKQGIKFKDVRTNVVFAQ